MEFLQKEKSESS